MVRGSVAHIDQVISGGAGSFTGTETEKTILTSPPDAVVVCLGLGARFLGGVEDKDVYPVRGQTILIKAPWIKCCMSLSGGASKIWTYIIPRRSGDVIIGGTYEANDWCDNLLFLISYNGAVTDCSSLHIVKASSPKTGDDQRHPDACAGDMPRNRAS